MNDISMVHPARIKHLNDRPPRTGLFVVYWMQQSQRVSCNHALNYAIEQANDLHLPLLVFFCLTGGFPEANLRHYRFMLDGLADTERLLRKHGIRLIVRCGDPAKEVARFSPKAALVVTDRGYLRIQRAWRATAATLLGCPLIQLETDVIVPVEEVSGKEEYTAATIRPKLHRRLAEFFVAHPLPRIMHTSLSLGGDSLDPGQPDALCSRLRIDRTVSPVTWLMAGETAAHAMLDRFVRDKLDRFATLRNDPAEDFLSNMSPYLHFGQISPYAIAQRVLDSGSRSAEAYLEELFVRRELAMNFVYYNDRYDSIDSLPAWSRRTLREHSIDEREYRYTLRRLERAQTHDPFWNAAQKEMVVRGKMHGYMRMYWGKKILEWSATPATAYRTALLLNNKYSLDGRDPNGFTGVAWCFGKHDRPWGERAIFGQVRYMNDKGLRRKFDIEAYVDKVLQWEKELT
ncbi:MAG: deoxyribodipyrimidine photo-lyase [Chitinispirillaceae bacterium]|nr:deoxyribodipyrimidine photo-lyase [Chitinispirillaceae bacterium]